MKKRGIIFILFLLIVLPVISAFFLPNPSDIFNKFGGVTGRAIGNRCIDTDGGMNYYIVGRTCLGSNCLNDTCANLNILKESYCRSGFWGLVSPSYILFNCTNECENGKCKSATTTPVVNASKNVTTPDQNVTTTPPANVTQNDSLESDLKDRCPEGTAYGNCSTAKPAYCDNGILKTDCAKCGCPTDFMCNSEGKCEPSSKSLLLCEGTDTSCGELVCQDCTAIKESICKIGDEKIYERTQKCVDNECQWAVSISMNSAGSLTGNIIKSDFGITGKDTNPNLIYGPADTYIGDSIHIDWLTWDTDLYGPLTSSLKKQIERDLKKSVDEVKASSSLGNVDLATTEDGFLTISFRGYSEIESSKTTCSKDSTCPSDFPACSFGKCTEKEETLAINAPLRGSMYLLDISPQAFSGKGSLGSALVFNELIDYTLQIEGYSPLRSYFIKDFDSKLAIEDYINKGTVSIGELYESYLRKLKSSSDPLIKYWEEDIKKSELLASYLTSLFLDKLITEEKAKSFPNAELIALLEKEKGDYEDKVKQLSAAGNAVDSSAVWKLCYNNDYNVYSCDLSNCGSGDVIKGTYGAKISCLVEQSKANSLVELKNFLGQLSKLCFNSVEGIFNCKTGSCDTGYILIGVYTSQEECSKSNEIKSQTTQTTTSSDLKWRTCTFETGKFRDTSCIYITDCRKYYSENPPKEMGSSYSSLEECKKALYGDASPNPTSSATQIWKICLNVQLGTENCKSECVSGELDEGATYSSSALCNSVISPSTTTPCEPSSSITCGISYYDSRGTFCGTGTKCATGETCASGSCVPGETSSSGCTCSHCSSVTCGDACYDSCGEWCGTGTKCATGETCASGSCVPEENPTTPSTTDNGKTCYNPYTGTELCRFSCYGNEIDTGTCTIGTGSAVAPISGNAVDGTEIQSVETVLEDCSLKATSSYCQSNNVYTDSYKCVDGACWKSSSLAQTCPIICSNGQCTCKPQGDFCVFNNRCCSNRCRWFSCK